MILTSLRCAAIALFEILYFKPNLAFDVTLMNIVRVELLNK